MKYFIIFLWFLSAHNHLYSSSWYRDTLLDPITLDDSSLGEYFSRVLSTPPAPAAEEVRSSELLNADASRQSSPGVSEDLHSSSSSMRSSESSQDVVSSEGEGVEPSSVPAQTHSSKKKKKKKKKPVHSGPEVNPDLEVDPDEAILAAACQAAREEAVMSLMVSGAPSLTLDIHEFGRFFPFGGFKSHFGFLLRNKFKTISEIEKDYFDLPRSSVLQTYVFREPDDITPLMNTKTKKQDMVLYEIGEESILRLGFGDRLVRIYGKPKEGAVDPHQKCFLELIIKNASRIYGAGEEGYAREEEPLEDDEDVRSVYIKLLKYLDGIPAFEEVSPELVRSKIASERRSISESRTFYYLAVREKGSENAFLVAVRNKPRFLLDIIQHSADPEHDAAVLEKLNSYFTDLPCFELPEHVDLFKRRI
jgi:hypothetical protein